MKKEKSNITISAELKHQWDDIIEAGKPANYSFVTAEEDDSENLFVTYHTNIIEETKPTITGTYTTKRYTPSTV